MPMDALCLSLALRETAAAVVGGRIDKIHQPSRDAVLLHVRGANGPCRLLLSADPARARIALTELLRENPVEPPMIMRDTVLMVTDRASRRASGWPSWWSRPPTSWATASSAA